MYRINSRAEQSTKHSSSHGCPPAADMLLLACLFFGLYQITQLPTAAKSYLCEKVNPLIQKLQFLCALKFPVNERLRSQPTFLLLLDITSTQAAWEAVTGKTTANLYAQSL